MVNTLINSTAELVIIMSGAFSKYLVGDLRDTADKDLTSTGLIAEIKDQLKKTHNFLDYQYLGYL